MLFINRHPGNENLPLRPTWRVKIKTARVSSGRAILSDVEIL